jgi:Zn-finger nucleic acid-binding protein
MVNESPGRCPLCNEEAVVEEARTPSGAIAANVAEVLCPTCSGYLIDTREYGKLSPERRAEYSKLAQELYRKDDGSARLAIGPAAEALLAQRKKARSK